MSWHNDTNSNNNSLHERTAQSPLIDEKTFHEKNGHFNIKRACENLIEVLKQHPENAGQVLSALLKMQNLHHRSESNQLGGEANMFECFRSALQTDQSLLPQALNGSLENLFSNHCAFKDITVLQIDYILSHHPQYSKMTLGNLDHKIKQKDASVSFETYETLASVVSADPSTASDAFRLISVMHAKDPTPQENVNAMYEVLKVISVASPKDKPEVVRFFKKTLTKGSNNISSWNKCMLNMLQNPER